MLGILRMSALALTMIASASLAQGQDAENYPAESIIGVVAFSAGGGTDTFTRLIAEDLAKELGQPIVVENRPGASGFVGWRSVASADPDGYTLLFSENAIALNTALRPQRDFDPTTQLDPVVHLATAPLVLVVAKDVEAKTVEELAGLSQQMPEGLSFSSSGIGSVSHLTFEALADAAGIKAVHVPYKGGGEALTAVAGGHADAHMTTVHVAKKMVDAGEVKAIAITGPKRADALPDVPTMSEAGVETDVDLTFWYGIYAPAETPEPIKAKIAAAADKVMQDPAVAERLSALSITPQLGTGEELGGKLGSEIEKWTAFLQSKGITVEE
jgi:tripartite-type tricarboxylate transporter receptor subunit TctC